VIAVGLICNFVARVMPDRRRAHDLWRVPDGLELGARAVPE
jgi:hypothetical protein